LDNTRLGSNWKNTLTPEEWRKIIISIGTHSVKRPLSPIEVGKFIHKLIISAKKKNVSERQIALELQLRDTSMIRRFDNLNNIPEEFNDFIIWGNKDGFISFTSASFATELSSKNDIGSLLQSIIEHKLNKNEVRQIIEFKRRTNSSIEECLKEILLARPKIIHRYMLMGSLSDVKFKEKFLNMDKFEKNNLFFKFLKNQYPLIEIYVAHISESRFSIITNEDGKKMIESYAAQRGESFGQYLKNKVEKWMAMLNET